MPSPSEHSPAPLLADAHDCISDVIRLDFATFSSGMAAHTSALRGAEIDKRNRQIAALYG